MADTLDLEGERHAGEPVAVGDDFPSIEIEARRPARRRIAWLKPVTNLYALLITLFFFLTAFFSLDWIVGLIGVLASLITMSGVLLAHAGRTVMLNLFLVLFLASITVWMNEFEAFSEILFLICLHMLGVAGPLRLLRFDLRRAEQDADLHKSRFSIREGLEWTAALACLFACVRWYITQAPAGFPTPWKPLLWPAVNAAIGLIAVWAAVGPRRQLALRASLLMLIGVVGAYLLESESIYSATFLIFQSTLVAMTVMMVTYRPTTTALEPSPEATSLHCSPQDSGLP